MAFRWMNGSGPLQTLVLPAALLSTAFLCGCKKPVAAAPPPPIVEVIEIKTSEVPLTSTLIGQLDSPQNVEIRARVEAFVDKMPFTEGVEVKQGDVLFELDQKPFLEKLAAANGSLAESKAALGKYRADVARLKPLYAKNAIPKQDLDNAVASVDVGLAGVESAQARVESAQLDLDYCTVKAPMAGLIGAKQVSIGDLVGKGEPTLLATMSTLDPIWFYCNVSEVDYIRAQEKSRKLGKEVDSLPLTLILAGGKELPDQGHFVFIDRAVDVKTGTLRIRAEFPNPDKLLRPGMFARVRVDIGMRKDCIAIPERALVELQGKSFVWVVGADGTTSQRSVTVGEQVESNVLVLEGLKPGERIIVEGVQKAREGAPVTPLTAAQAAATKSAPAAEVKPAKE
ncbi:MAG: efflux RND transporter periplasmic adaptor subunit [Akkermansiaceae bacterium]|nr:efflux RND transporter periplasmic adaptor subunit [Akkermansiaceae bacterium]